MTQSVPWLYSSVAISGASLFALSNLYISRKLPKITSLQRFLLSFFDLGAYFCLVALVVWGLLFPILRPITDPNFQLYLLGQKSLAMEFVHGVGPLLDRDRFPHCASAANCSFQHNHDCIPFKAAIRKHNSG